MAIVIEPGHNPRTEDLDLDELKPLIATHGYRQDRPISLYKDGDTLKLIDGQRRLLCVRALIAEGQAIPRIPAILLPRMADPAERLVSALAANRGKRLSPGDEARAFQRLLNFGWNAARIATAYGCSDELVRNRLALLDAVPVVTEALSNGHIGVSEAVKIVRKAERTSTPQAEVLEHRQATKVDRRKERTAVSAREQIIEGLNKLIDKHGVDEVRRVVVFELGL
jgi:ParB-like chromosome segregation protein Spo0J